MFVGCRVGFLDELQLDRGFSPAYMWHMFSPSHLLRRVLSRSIYVSAICLVPRLFQAGHAIGVACRAGHRDESVSHIFRFSCDCYMYVYNITRSVLTVMIQPPKIKDHHHQRPRVIAIEDDNHDYDHHLHHHLEKKKKPAYPKAVHHQHHHH